MSIAPRGVVLASPMPPKPEYGDDPATGYAVGAQELLAQAGVELSYGIPLEFPEDADFHPDIPAMLASVTQERADRGLAPLALQRNVLLGADPGVVRVTAATRYVEAYSHDTPVITHLDASAPVQANIGNRWSPFANRRAREAGEVIAQASIYYVDGFNPHSGIDVGYNWHRESTSSVAVGSLVRIINATFEAWPKGQQPPHYVHIPFGNQHPGSQEPVARYYKPLADLELPAGTRLAVGIGEQEGEQGKTTMVFTRNCIEHIVGKPVDVSPAHDLSQHEYYTSRQLVASALNTSRSVLSQPRL